MIVEYQLLVSTDPEEMAMLINNFIDKDWRPHGGVAISQRLPLHHEPHDVKTLFAQAMVKDGHRG